MDSRALASLFIGIGISAFGLWYAFKGVDLAAVADGIRTVGPIWVFGSVAAALLSLVIRAIRWRVLLIWVTPVRLGTVVSATFIGIMANNILPARLGEVVRAWLVARHEQAEVSTVLASVVVERLVDVMAALAIFGLCLILSPDLEEPAAGLLARSGLLVMVMVIAGLACLAAAVRWQDGLLRAAGRWVHRAGGDRLSGAIDLLRRFLEGLHTLRGPGQIGSVIVLSFVLWGVAIASFSILAQGFNLGLNPVQVSLVFVIVLFGIAVPSAPGFVGTFHSFCVAGLAMVAGTEPTRAAAYATLLHASHWLSMNLVGLGCLLADRTVTWRSLIRLGRP